MYCGLIISNTALTIRPQYKTNIYVETIGSIDSEIATINYPLQTYNNISNFKGRAITRTYGTTLYYQLLLETNIITDNLTFNITDQTLGLKINTPMIQYMTNAYTKFGYVDQLDQSQQEFLEDTNYTDYYDILNHVLIDENLTTIEEENDTYTSVADEVYLTYNHQYKQYLYFELTLNYNNLPQELRNNLRNNLNIVSEINLRQNYRIELPNNTYEVIDLAGLMFTILGMPFAWFSTAFNFTIFAGTPYAINIGEILLSLIAVMIGLIIIRIVIKR